MTGAHFYFMPNLIKIAENEYRISGEQKATYEDVKTVTVDGAKYSRTEYVERVFSYDEDFSSLKKDFDWTKIEADELCFLGMNAVTVWDYRWRYNTAIDGIAPCDCKYSNGSVHILKFLFHLNLLDHRISNIYTSKKQTWQTYLDKDKAAKESLYRHHSIDVLVFEYGFQNATYCTISLKYFLGLDMNIFKGSKYEPIQKIIPEISTTKKYMSDETKLIVAFRIFESQIKYFENENLNEQRSIYAYMRSNGETVPEENNG